MLMKPGSVVVDLAAEQGGNCDLTQKDKIIESKNGVKIVGYTDFPSRMAAQSSTLYATNIRHMLDDLTPEKDGALNVNMEDDVIRGATVVHRGKITFPPPPPKVQAIGKQTQTATVPELTPEEKSLNRAGQRAGHWSQTGRIAGIGRFVHVAGWRLCPFQLYAAFYSICALLFCWLSGYMECQPCLAYATHGGHQCDFRHYNYWRIIADWLAQLASRNSGRYFCIDCHH